MQIAGSKELAEQVQNKELCVSCGACVGLCPYFKAHKGKVVMTFPCELSQGRCYAHCPRTEVDFDGLSRKIFGSEYNGSPLGTYRRIAASKAGEKMGSGPFQNGGTVSALTTLALKSGLIDAAVLTGREGMIPVPRLVTQPEEVLQCASTKYMATPTVACVNLGEKEGYQKMGIVGTACQLTAVAQMKCNPLEKEDFKDSTALSIGLFCTWALDTKKFIDFISTKIDTDEITGMDVPPPPAETFVVKAGGKTVEIPLNDIRALVPKGCSLCPDMTAEWSDLSVGAFEGKSEWNTLIIRSEKGEALVDQAVKEGFLVVDDFPAASLDHLTLGAGNKKKRAQDNAKKEEK